MSLLKPKRTVDPDYLQYIREEPCLVCRENAEPHHLLTVKTYGSDYTAVPLCREHHTEAGTGFDKFQEKYKINLWKDAQKLNEQYFLREREDEH